MKTFRNLLLFLLLPAASQAQNSLTGLWSGTLSNDSSTIRKDQSFELALTEYKGKVYGYTRTAFIVRDTLFYTVKRVKGVINDGVCEVKDDEVISTNFPGRQDKGVRVSYTFRQRLEDTTWHLDGNWKTNKTKTYYSISGGVALRSEKNWDNSKLFPHLQELNKLSDVAFYKEAKDRESAVAKSNSQTPQAPAAKTDVPSKPVAKKEDPVIAKTTKEEIKSQKDFTNTTSTPAVKSSVAPVVPAQPAAFVKERTNSTPKVITFKSDSLVLALYDNGEVDGDTVSVLLNGEVVVAKQMLKASAFRKTIYLPSGQEESVLLLYAENLGRFPPNTGLLVIYDGEESYQLHFSADLQNNASVIFRRKKD